MSVTTAADVMPISDYGILGYGIDIVNNEPLQPVVDFTYIGKKTFSFDRPILLPDQFIFDPTPVHKMTDLRYSGIMTTARQYQVDLSAEVGLGGEVDGVEFSGSAKSVNKMFSRETQTSIRQYISINAEYIILRISAIRAADALRPAVVDAARAASNVDGAVAFYRSYGTHLVKEASVGGRMSVSTELSLTSSNSKSITENSVKIDGEAKTEAGEYVNGSIDFGVRSQKTSRDYRSNSTVKLNLIGGDIAAPKTEKWRDSLKQSEIATRSDLSSHPGTLSSGPHHYLGLIGLKYVPLHSVLNLTPDRRTTFEKALKQYLGGINPFDDSPQRFKPDVPESTAVKPGGSHRFGMRGWMATYETYAGLEGKPGSYAVVKCKSDAEAGGWTEGKVYAGETIKLREKTAYMSGNMDVTFVSASGDDGATVYFRNLLVSW
jgi:MAC/Perforin domain